MAGCKTPTGGTIALYAEARMDTVSQKETVSPPAIDSTLQPTPKADPIPPKTEDLTDTTKQTLKVSEADTTSAKKTTPSEVEPLEPLLTDAQEIIEPDTLHQTETDLDTLQTALKRASPDDALRNELREAEKALELEKQQFTEQLEKQKRATEKAEQERDQRTDELDRLQQQIDDITEALQEKVNQEKRSAAETAPDSEQRRSSSGDAPRTASDRSDRTNQDQSLSNEDLLYRLMALQTLTRSSGDQNVVITTDSDDKKAAQSTPISESEAELKDRLTLMQDSIAKMKNDLRRYKALSELKLDSIGREDSDLNRRYLDDLRMQTDSLNRVLERMEALNRERKGTTTPVAKPDTVFKEVVTEVVREVQPEKPRTKVLTAYYNRGAMIPQNQNDIINEILSAVKDESVERVKLSGHTDRSGNAAVNLDFSRRRVEGLRDALIAKGLDDTLIFSQYFGSRFASEEVVEEERRVEITIVFGSSKD